MPVSSNENSSNYEDNLLIALCPQPFSYLHSYIQYIVFLSVFLEVAYIVDPPRFLFLSRQMSVGTLVERLIFIG